MTPNKSTSDGMKLRRRIQRAWLRPASPTASDHHPSTNDRPRTGQSDAGDTLYLLKTGAAHLERQSLPVAKFDGQPAARRRSASAFRATKLTRPSKTALSLPVQPTAQVNPGVDGAFVRPALLVTARRAIRCHMEWPLHAPTISALYRRQKGTRTCSSTSLHR